MENKAKELIAEFKSKRSTLHSEEDVRSGFATVLTELSRAMKFDLQLTGHEVTSAHGGAADSVYANVIFEYKSPNKFHTTNGRDEAVYGRSTELTDRGLFHYLINFTLDETAHHTPDSFLTSLKSKIGVGFDGFKFIFCRFLDGKEEIDLYDPNKTSNFGSLPTKANLNFEVDLIEDFDIGIKKLLLILRSTTRFRLAGSTLLTKFGPNSALCKKAINQIYTNLETNLRSNPRVSTLFDEWNRIFGDIYGEIETDFTTIKKPICDYYGLPETIVLRKTLFSIQTYYNLILKLLISDLFVSLKDPSLAHKTTLTRNELNLLFSGKMTTDYKVDNFFEINYFEWFIYAIDFDLNIITDILLEIQTIETTASVIRPEIVEDSFREMYEGLMPPELRHLMGEYYTPGWLVDFVLDKAGYVGQKDKTLLDPCCGSGSFIAHAIKRLRRSGFDNQNDFITAATTNIIGYDINPITVISAKTNYLLSLGDISEYDKVLSIPVYMCDSILVPTVHAKQKESTNSIKVNTVVGKFNLPVFNNRFDSDLFLKEVSKCVESYSFEEFLEYIKANTSISFDGVNLKVAKEFYNKVCDLHLTSKDGYWGIILKNSFAPLFAKGGCDFVVGNPPWISWKAMSDTYRKQTLDIWLSYDIFNKSAYDKITTHDDFAMAVTYVSVDHYCKPNGLVAFVLPQTFLKASKGGEGFRKFRITRDKNDIPFSVKEVFDMSEINPFRGFASNKASVIVFEKNKEMEYPMDSYYLCHKKPKKLINHNDSYELALSKFSMERMMARPIKKTDIRSPWLTLTEEGQANAEKYLGKSDYSGRKGIEPCGAKGIYLIEVLSEKDGLIKIQNLIERSRLAEAKAMGVFPAYIEKDHVYPMVGGRNIEKWGINSHIYMVVPHYSSGKSIYSGIPETELKVRYPRTYNWLNHFHDVLLKTRTTSGKFFNPDTQPFYRLDNVGPYTFQKYHVVWREQNKTMVAAVVSEIDDEYLGLKATVFDSKVLFCPLDNESEAHYLCALLNSPTITHIIDSYAISTNRGTDVLNNIKISKFDPSNNLHQKLASLSLKAHANKAAGKDNAQVESEIEEIVKKLFE